MDRTFIIRALSLYAPVCACFAVWNWRRPAGAEATGALLATAWNVPALLALNSLASWFGWWHFHVQGAVFLGTPVDLWLGWSALWGAFAVLAFRRTPVWITCCFFASFDILVMPLCSPVVSLGRGWLIGEFLGLALCVVPAHYFARWSKARSHTGRRAAMQFVVFSSLFVIGVLVAQSVSQHPIAINLGKRSTQFMLQLLFVIALPGLSAVQEFAVIGNGTPLPYDPPARLVTSGIYAYIANPMQTSTILLLLAIALALHSLWLLGAGVVAIIYCAGLAAWDEDSDLQQRYGAAFSEYRLHVRNWVPQWRPFIGTARIYVSADCFKCSQMGSFLRELRPVNLETVPAEEHPSRDLQRMTYESSGGAVEEQGIAALARALEHVNFLWAFAGMTLRLPLVNALLQKIVDASGGGPFQVTRRSCPIPVSRQRNGA